MWTLPGASRPLARAAALLTALAAGSVAEAQVIGPGYPNNYLYTNQTYGLYLPQVPQPSGQDEIRAADGTTCRSSMASNDAYLDVGGLGGSSADGSFNTGTVYTRVIIPLGGVPKRLDCSSLYQLEIERLRHELELVRSGLGAGMAAVPGGRDQAWAESGWTQGAKPGVSVVEDRTAAIKPPSNVYPPAMRLQPKPQATIGAWAAEVAQDDGEPAANPPKTSVTKANEDVFRSPLSN